eukprot:184023-Hanusia_phi.AAC.1
MMASSPTNGVDKARTHAHTHKAKKSLGSHGRKAPDRDYTPSSQQLSPRSSHRTVPGDESPEILRRLEA